MQLRRLVLLTMLAIHCSAISESEEQPNEALPQIEQALKKSNEVSFYFLGRTGEWDWKPPEFRKQAGVSIVRKCGGNCNRFMADVRAHIEASFPAKCLSGQQDLVIDIGEEMTLIYSHSGRILTFDGTCYYNPDSLSLALRKGFFFN